MADLGVPSSLAELGYHDDDDVPRFVEGALAQQRPLAVAPRAVGEADLADILGRSL
jgi:alcohol dehydrogenase class IV